MTQCMKYSVSGYFTNSFLLLDYVKSFLFLCWIITEVSIQMNVLRRKYFDMDHIDRHAMTCKMPYVCHVSLISCMCSCVAPKMPVHMIRILLNGSMALRMLSPIGFKISPYLEHSLFVFKKNATLLPKINKIYRFIF